MRRDAVDLLARALGRSDSRRGTLAAFAALVFVADADAARRRKKKRSRRRPKRGSASPRQCTRFDISAGPDRNDRFQHTDDDLLIQVIPQGGGAARTIFDDDNDSVNGPNGENLQVDSFTARVGDQIRIVARNEVAGRCELDEIWLHCLDNGGKAKLTDAITQAECQDNWDQTGVFFETTVRIKDI